MRKAFTIAEVLITLGIIGVVAAITLPVVVSRYREKVYVNQLKKVYSILNQAFEMSVVKNSTPDSWGLTNDAQGSIMMGDIISRELKLVKNCGTDSGCWPDINYKYLNGNNWINVNTYETFYKVVLSDGTLVRFAISNPDCNSINGTSNSLKHTCGIIGVDINGFKQPNTVGIDYFNFWVTKYGIVPYGSIDNTVHAFQAQCSVRTQHTGMACTAWVLANENMDYLHCSDLSWNGKSKCGKR